MKINLVIMSDAPKPRPGTMVEVQLPTGETLVSGGLEVARLFEKFTPSANGKAGSEAGWRFIPYDIDPYTAPGVLGVALQREAQLAAKENG